MKLYNLMGCLAISLGIFVGPAFALNPLTAALDLTKAEAEYKKSPKDPKAIDAYAKALDNFALTEQDPAKALQIWTQALRLSPRDMSIRAHYIAAARARGLNPTAQRPTAAAPNTVAPGTKTVDFGPYMGALQRQIASKWTPPKGHETDVVVTHFKLARNGSISDLKLEKGTGDVMVNMAALAAVKSAAPFATLPAGAPDTVDIQFAFDKGLYARYKH